MAKLQTGGKVADVGCGHGISTVTYYAASTTTICLPTSLSQEVALGLGAQAVEAKLREVVTKGGYTQFRRTTETPINMILEARL